ncbi:hypothetical protein [Paenibacillus sp. FSL R7-0026]|uniref:hypothetical protein n=1 Tax=Paenibacillus sp. FSL R7-0026 TaxID=2921668 RepID=UPI0030F6ADF2
MKKHVIYYYHVIGEQADIIHNDSYFVLETYRIAGLTNPRNSKQLNLRLRPFELQQNNLYSLISKSEKLKLQILKVEFDDIDYELEEEFKDALKSRSASNIYEISEIIRSENVDISAITFNYGDRQYRVHKYAVAEIIGEWEELPILTVETPLAMAIGFKKFPTERTFGY